MTIKELQDQLAAIIARDAYAAGMQLGFGPDMIPVLGGDHRQRRHRLGRTVARSDQTRVCRRVLTSTPTHQGDPSWQTAFPHKSRSAVSSPQARSRD